MLLLELSGGQMADRRSGATGAPDQGMTTASRAAAIADLLLLEISNLLELYVSGRETSRFPQIYTVYVCGV